MFWHSKILFLKFPHSIKIIFFQKRFYYLHVPNKKNDIRNHKNRRAVFPAQYNGQAITKEEILTILESANWAPTHKRTEPWRFKVFHGTSQVALGKFMAETYKQTTDN